MTVSLDCVDLKKLELFTSSREGGHSVSGINFYLILLYAPEERGYR